MYIYIFLIGFKYTHKNVKCYPVMTQNFWKSVRVQFTSGCSDAGSSKFRAPTVNPKLQRKPKPKEADCGEYNPKAQHSPKALIYESLEP